MMTTTGTTEPTERAPWEESPTLPPRRASRRTAREPDARLLKLQAVGLAKRYRDKTALNNIDFTFNEGIYGLLGANGAGKTTFMRLLCGLQRPTAGRLLLDGQNVLALGERYRDLLGYLPQQFEAYPDFSARDFLLYMATLKGLDAATAKTRADELLDAVGLTRDGRRKVRAFSGGMKQRLGIAQALLNDPRILILDEPTAGLDPKERMRFRNLLGGFARNRIVILATHIVSDVSSLAEQILILRAGCLLCAGSPAALTETLRGRVWECTVPDAEAARLSAMFTVSRVQSEAGVRTTLRILAEHRPVSTAVAAAPDLEDLYLYHFRESSETGRSVLAPSVRA